jgi:hypothetical protein
MINEQSLALLATINHSKLERSTATDFKMAGGGIKLKCRRRKTKREQHRTHRQKIGKPAVSADGCRKENTDGDLWFTRKSHEQNEFLSCQLLTRRQQMRREESKSLKNLNISAFFKLEQVGKEKNHWFPEGTPWLLVPFLLFLCSVKIQLREKIK